MLFTCLPEGAQIPGRFPGPVHARGKWFTIDIHCHLLTQKAEEMVKDAGLSMDWQPRHHFANERTREVNREQGRRTRIQFTSIEKRLQPPGWGTVPSDMAWPQLTVAIRSSPRFG